MSSEFSWIFGGLGPGSLAYFSEPGSAESMLWFAAMLGVNPWRFPIVFLSTITGESDSMGFIYFFVDPWSKSKHCREIVSNLGKQKVGIPRFSIHCEAPKIAKIGKKDRTCDMSWCGTSPETEAFAAGLMNKHPRGLHHAWIIGKSEDFVGKQVHNEHGQSEIQLLQKAKLKQEVAALFLFRRLVSVRCFPFLEFDNLGNYLPWVHLSFWSQFRRIRRSTYGHSRPESARGPTTQWNCAKQIRHLFWVILTSIETI